MQTIDYEKCVKCQRCIEDCITNFLISCKDSDDYRIGSPIAKERGRCMKCGHCISICPSHAISDDELGALSFEDELLEIFCKKRSVRAYRKNSNISREIIDRIIMAAESAPTDHGRTTVRTILVKDKLQKLYYEALDYLVSEVTKVGPIDPLYSGTMKIASKRDEVLWNAEYLVVFIGLERYTVDAAISAERMQLEAYVHGVGSCYRGDMLRAINACENLRTMLGMRKNETALVAFAMGQTDTVYHTPLLKKTHKVEFM